MILTIAEIKDLAQFAGFVIDETRPVDDLETEIVVTTCPAGGADNEDGTFSHFRYIAYLDEYPEEGVMGLGPEISTK